MERAEADGDLADEDVDDEFGRRQRGRRGAGGALAGMEDYDYELPGPPGGHAAPGRPQRGQARGEAGRGSDRDSNRGSGRGSNRGSRPRGMNGGEDYYAQMMPGADGEYGYGGYGGYGRSSVVGEGARVVSVTAIVPFDRQLRELARAMNERNTRAVERHLRYIDFELERQRAVAGPEQWGPWEPVDLEATKDRLMKVADFDDEVVDLGITHPVLTCPIPERLMGYWDDMASHPRVKNFEETPDGKRLQRLLTEVLARREAELERQMDEQIVDGGFASLVRDVRSLRGAVMDSGDYDAIMEDMTTGYESMYQQRSSGPRLSREQLKKEFERRITARDSLLLFRYFDFDVEPGNAYRYRVRLKLVNPNYDRLADVIAPFVAEGRFRFTEWSEATKPIVVPYDHEYYLRQARVVRSMPRARFDVFQWYPETGTLINSELELTPGQAIGGEKETLLLELPDNFEQKNVTFRTNNLLVDLDVPPQLNPADHPDLNIPSSHRGGVRGPDLALVADEFGELTWVDGFSKQNARERAKQRFERMKEAFEDLLEKSKPQEGYEGDLYELYGEMYGGAMMEEDYGGRRGRGRRGPNPLRRPR
jgi:hypothetical protein